MPIRQNSKTPLTGSLSAIRLPRPSYIKRVRILFPLGGRGEGEIKKAVAK
jgi:hypothetical protein